MLGDYDPNPVQTALDIFAAKDEDKLRAHFDAMGKIEKEMFEYELLRDPYVGDGELTTWYMQNCATMGFIMAIGMLMKLVIKIKREK